MAIETGGYAPSVYLALALGETLRSNVENLFGLQAERDVWNEASALGPRRQRAIVIWSGFRERATPVRDERRLVDRYGPDAAADLMPAVRELEADFYSSDAADHEADLGEAGEAAVAEFRMRHPKVSDDAVAALAWCFTYDWK